MSYPIPDLALQILTENPDISGAELSRRTGIPGRSARRYVNKFKEEQEDTPVPFTRVGGPRPAVSLRAAVYDIEVTDFSTEGYGGMFVLACILPLDSDEITTVSIEFEDAHDDRRALREVREELAKYDILIGHNIAAFDYNWLCSRLMFYGMPPLRAHQYYDTYQVAKSLAIKTGKGLGNLMDYFGIPAEKTSVYRTSWMNVMSPKRNVFQKAVDDIQYHCEQDVLGNRMLFDVLYPYSMANSRANPFKKSKSQVMEWSTSGVSLE